jgi:hypothetical protein
VLGHFQCELLAPPGLQHAFAGAGEVAGDSQRAGSAVADLPLDLL